MKRVVIISLCIIGMFFSCSESENPSQSQAHSHSHTNELEPIIRTVYSENHELFVEFSPLITGEATSFSAHLTRLSDFKPVEEGTLSVFFQGKPDEASSAVEYSTPGIFQPEISPSGPGNFNIVFKLTTGDSEDEIVVRSVKVYNDNHEPYHDMEEHVHSEEEIIFSKDQSWKIDFATEPVEASDWYDVIRTSGEILQAQGDELILTAHHSGIVLFRKSNILAGSEIKNGESLFNISSGNLVEDNVQEEYLKAKSNFEKSKQDYERAQLLIEDRLITESEFLDIKLNYENANNTFNTFKKNYYQGGAEVKSTETGFIKQVFVSEGQYVETGQPLASITKNKKLIIKADVSQKYFNQLSLIRSANFRTIYDDQIHDIADLDGQLISYGKNVDKSSFYTPVYFEINNVGNFISGSFIEIFLKGAVIANAVVIPKSAILEETGSFYVFIQESGETFIKRDIELGTQDGQYVRIISGLEPGERIVTRGVNRVKLASLKTELPSHGHAH